MRTPYLSDNHYHDVLLAALHVQGVPLPLAETLIAARLPTHGSLLIAECSNRGIDMTLADVEEYLWQINGGNTWFDGEIVDVERTLFHVATIDSLLEWASVHRRGKPSATSQTVREILEARGELERFEPKPHPVAEPDEDYVPDSWTR
jgi:hypothetical protein